jgi:hypothetical protein
MSTVKAKDVSEARRNGMSAESLVLAYDSGVNLASVAAVHAIAAGMSAAGDPLEKVWIEFAEGKKKQTLGAEEAVHALDGTQHVRFLRGLARSERGNAKSRWLTSGTVFNSEPHSRTLFYGLPVEISRVPFAPHHVLLRSLVSAGLTPQYGFGFVREYGLGPDYFSIGYVYNATLKDVDQSDWRRIQAWSNERAGNPADHPERHRHLRGMILDVFPMNVLNDVHLRQFVEGLPLKQWILRETGEGSLVQISDRCAVWSVAEERRAPLSARLDEAGLIIAGPRKTRH